MTSNSESAGNGSSSRSRVIVSRNSMRSVRPRLHAIWSMIPQETPANSTSARGDAQSQRRNPGAALFENPYAATDVTREIGQSASVEPSHPVERRAVNLVHAIAGRGLDHGLLWDGSRQHEPVIVVGMVTQQIDPPGGARADDAVDAEYLPKAAAGD